MTMMTTVMEAPMEATTMPTLAVDARGREPAPVGNWRRSPQRVGMAWVMAVGMAVEMAVGMAVGLAVGMAVAPFLATPSPMMMTTWAWA